MTTRENYIGAVDYVVFGITLAFSAGIGIFYAFKDRKSDNMANFHRGNKQIHPIAVSLSLSVTILSALTIIGVPAETYTHGTMIWWEIIAMLLATAITAQIFLPIFYRMDRISIFEYLEMRYGKVMRLLGSFTYILVYCITVSFALYAPCLAFEAMTGIVLWIVMLVASGVVMTYTLLGGMKAVVWADAFQFTIIIAGMLCMLIEGSKAVGGFTKAWAIAQENDRIEFFNASVDPRTRHTLWSLLIGFTIQWCYLFGANQATIQRACSLPTLRIAKMATWLSWPGSCLIFTLSVLNGIVMFAYYKDCDPVKEGRVGNNNQIFPLMILDLIGNIPGLPGLLLACIFGGALSSISSGLNAISAVVVEDFIKPYSKSANDKRLLLFSKVCVVVVNISVFLVALGISQLGGLILQMIQTTASIVAGPMLGCFVIGMFFPWTNSYGAVAGVIGSMALTAWLTLGSLLNLPPLTGLAVSVEGCMPISTVSTSLNTSTSALMNSTTMFTSIESQYVYSAIDEFYRMSYLWFCGFGALCYTIIAFIVSFLSKPTPGKQVDGRLMSPVFYNICGCLTEKYRRKLLFGVDYNKRHGDDKEMEIDVKMDQMSLENGHKPKNQIYPIITHI